MSISLIFTYNIEQNRTSHETKIVTDVQFKIKFSELVEYSECSIILYKLVTFLCLCKGDVVCVKTVIAQSRNLTIPIAGSNPMTANISVFYGALPFKKEHKEKDSYDFLFKMNEIGGAISEKLDNWFNLFEKINDPIHVFFTTFSEDSMDMHTRFLLYSQCLEAFHRKTVDRKQLEEKEYKALVKHLKANCDDKYKSWLTNKLYGNELFLLERLQELYKGVDFILRDEIVSAEPEKIKNTRNYLTHFDEQQKKNAVLDSNLYFLSIRMGIVFLLHMLKMTGFEDNKIKKAASDHFRIRQILSR